MGFGGLADDMASESSAMVTSAKLGRLDCGAGFKSYKTEMTAILRMSGLKRDNLFALKIREHLPVEGLRVCNGAIVRATGVSTFAAVGTRKGCSPMYQSANSGKA